MRAHTALTKLARAEKAIAAAGADLTKLITALSLAVKKPGKGRRADVEALNRSAYVLLCAHFQGFVDDLHAECAGYTLAGRVADIAKTTELVKPRNANPHSDVIERMFCGIGVFDIMQAVCWEGSCNDKVKKRLTGYIVERNKIAHGNKPKIAKSKVTAFHRFVRLLAESLDEEACRKVEELTGTRPW